MVDDNTMYVSVPKLLNDTYRLQLDTLGADYNASAWKDQLGFKVDSDVSIDFSQEKMRIIQIWKN